MLLRNRTRLQQRLAAHKQFGVVHPSNSVGPNNAFRKEMKPPVPFTNQHFSLAKKFGIARDKIGFVADLASMRAAAEALGVSQEELDSYSDTTLGICINDVPGGPNVRIYLRTPLSEQSHSDTYFRLDQLQLNPVLDLIDSTETSLLYAFLLLHEVGHHVLKHSPAEAYKRREEEADKWACETLRPIYRRFLLAKRPDKAPEPTFGAMPIPALGSP
jgi:hypothetical protein